ncbi:pyridoxamine 5'-phosphate oxidase family protein [Pseudoalteromonas sp. SWYJ118]|uniref:2Fe-2S iron-sulfur cluster-binding protein n=1 Tax=Pseudoalteromonas sp. SWYJ118 TaxID=2792062 RepID=UPI0018CD711D|nr:pyridoxamine 5'-phosphate oxidase family protein [Pseudoalteromonas sp. SWYJ118]MBH0074537.1 pyridoxamine 5'-phosphate oxidase family protein [Pseudoalteromonas sp. SWYJ118]
MTNTNSIDASPFHEGELAIQDKLGKREIMATFGKRAVRSFMPEQHQAFFEQLPFVVAGSVDENADVWVSIVSGLSGFLSAPTPTSLLMTHAVDKNDPLHNTLKIAGSPIGLLGIELSTRRRNRLNVRVGEVISDNKVSFNVDQSFGNCPQYIQTRDLAFNRDPLLKSNAVQKVEFNTLDNAATTLIDTTDTFFVSSFITAKNNPKIEGVDVSHRGGMPGFVKREGNTLTIPDYAGNNFFNTMGNFLLNPKAGLLFPDFDTGNVLMLTGSVEILWDGHPELKGFIGADRGWKFTVTKGMWLKNLLPFTAKFDAYSPNTKMTGTWLEADKNKQAEKLKHAWQPLKVTKIIKDSDVITSFYLEGHNNTTLLPFKAGQHLTVQIPSKNSDNNNSNSKPVTRTYTVSSSPHELFYRLSIKKELSGEVSSYFHNNVKVGDVILAKYPQGQFFIDPTSTKPAVLIGGGIGITPMISMAKHIAHEGLRTRHTRPLHIFHSAKNTQQRAFYNELKTLADTSGGAIDYYSLLSQPVLDEKQGGGFNLKDESFNLKDESFDLKGRINADVFRYYLPLDDYEFFLCGPEAFMQHVYNELLLLGVQDKNIFAEAFGPSAINRKVLNTSGASNKSKKLNVEEADNTVIKFSKSGFEQRWNKGDNTILNVAEAHGLEPEFGCRNGSCGSCAVKINAGAVVYRNNVSYPVEAGQALICCAVPAKGVDELDLEL